MTPLDDLFSTDESRAESQFEKVVTLNPAEISDFPNHPFKVKQDDAMAEMVESVRKYGVLVPALVRPKENGGYEMVAGHRRKFAAALAELTEIPCIVRNLSDDEATIIMVDSNLQRETILPSEKAFAYKMKLEAMKRQGQRTDLTSSPLDNKLSGTTSAQQLSQKSGDSQPQIYRFIRLTELIPPVLQMVDDGKIAFRPAVELSYLSKDQQQSLHDTMECEDCTPSLAQAIKMKEFSKDGRLTDEVILSIMQEEKPNQKEQFKMPKERISKYFAPGTPAQKIEDTIVKALEMYRKRERQRDTSLDEKVYATLGTNQNKHKTAAVWSFRKISALAATFVLIISLSITAVFVLNKEPEHIVQEVIYSITISYENEQYGYFSNRLVIDKYGLNNISDLKQNPDLFTGILTETDIIQTDSVIDKDSIIGAKIYPYSDEVIILQGDGQFYYFEKIVTD